jgi:hypothetical protein
MCIPFPRALPWAIESLPLRGGSQTPNPNRKMILAQRRQAAQKGATKRAVPTVASTPHRCVSSCAPKSSLRLVLAPLRLCARDSFFGLRLLRLKLTALGLGPLRRIGRLPRLSCRPGPHRIKGSRCQGRVGEVAVPSTRPSAYSTIAGCAWFDRRGGLSARPRFSRPPDATKRHGFS